MTRHIHIHYVLQWSQIFLTMFTSIHYFIQGKCVFLLFTCQWWHRRYFKEWVRKNLINDSLCWKCKTTLGAYLHAFGECPLVFPLWRDVLKFMGKWLKYYLPISPRLCLLGDRTVVPRCSKFAFRVLSTGLMTCAWIILRCQKEPRILTMKMWKEQMMEIAACEKMLGRLSSKNDMVKEQWDSFTE